jgi:hypothetical protein
VKLNKYITDFALGCSTNLAGIAELGDVDATQNEVFCPYLLPGQWLSKVAVPGRELGPDDMWQMMEAENVKQEDYKTILRDGFAGWYEKCLKERCGDSEGQLVSLGFYDYLGEAKRRFIEAGIPCIADFLMITPFEFFCGGRTLAKFFVEDIYEEPDMVDEVFARVMEYTMPKYRAMLEATRPIGVWIGGWRTAPEMISPVMWERFVWPYFKQYAELCFEYDCIPTFHLDANWDLQLERFREMPAKKCIMGLDSKTDIRAAHKAVGDMMCIMGDVPPQLLAFGTTDAVKKYVTDLVDDIGPVGYIASSGCDIPSNAKKENVRAMCDAANEYLKR